MLRWLTLLLRCLAILLFCAAFARPFWGKSPSATRRALVIALDNSMSQQAHGRWEATQRWSLGQLEELKPGDQAALLLMEPEPTWLVPMTDDLSRVRAALAAAQPGYDKTRYARPLRLAGDTLAKTAAGTKILAWAADEQCAGWRGTDLAEKLPPGIRFRFMDIAPAPQPSGRHHFRSPIAPPQKIHSMSSSANFSLPRRINASLPFAPATMFSQQKAFCCAPETTS